MKSPEQLRKFNTLKVLRYISEVALATKSEIALYTQLTMVTTSNIINRLYDSSVLIKNGINNKNKGRNSIIYSFNNDKNHIIGINIGIDYISFREEDLDGNIYGRKYLQVDIDSTYDYIVAQILLYIKNKEYIIGIGITIPGVSNQETGKIEFMPNLQNIKNKYLQRDIFNATKIITIVEKDVYAGVSLFKENDSDNSIALISIIGGIGCGVINGNTVLKGYNQMAGEIGHISINSEGPLCSCGQKGCIETYASDYAICEKLGLSINDIIECGNNGGVECINILKKACDSLYILIGYVNKFYNPKEIIINCKWLYKVSYIYQYFEKLINKENKSIKIIYDKHNYEKGAVNIIKEKLLFEIDNNILLGG